MKLVARVRVYLIVYQPHLQQQRMQIKWLALALVVVVDLELKLMGVTLTLVPKNQVLLLLQI